MSTRSRLGASIARYARVLYRPPALAVAAMVIGAFVAAPHVRKLSRELLRQPLYTVDANAIRITRPHRWVRRGFFDQTLEAAGLQRPLSIADPSLVGRLRTGLESNPWVERVDRIEASLNSGIEIHLTYRNPAMTVQTPAGLYPVDNNGVELPTRDFTAEDAVRFPRLVLNDAPTAPAAGTRWRDARVVTAARIAAVLDDIIEQPDDSLWARCNLMQIRLSEADQEIFELISADGSRVVWGHHGDTARNVEPTADEKVEKLEQILVERGSLAAPAGPYLIDLRRWDVTTLEPLAVSTR